MAFQKISLFLFVALVNVQVGAALRIIVTPDLYTEDSSGDIHISCLTDHVDQCLHKHLLRLQISRDGEEPIAYAIADKIWADTARLDSAGGNVNERDCEAFLNITLTNPQNSFTGLYTCTMFYFLDSGIHNDTASKQLRVEVFDFHDAVNGLQNSLAELKGELTEKISEVSDVKTAIEELKETTKDMQSRLADKASQDSIIYVLDRVSEVEARSRNNSLRENKMYTPNKGTHTAAFVASLSRDITPTIDDVIVFPDVTMNKGQGYNATSGVFKAPWSGIYFFNMVLTTKEKNSWFEVDIKKGDEVLVSLGVGDMNYWLQSSVSVLSDLKAGEEVRAVATRNNNNRRLSADNLSSMFTGYLMKTS